MASGWATGRDSVSAVDPTYGQRSVFGNAGQATAIADEDLDVEDEQEALEYLRLVRAEAGKIPHVMIAPRHGPQAFPQHVMKSMALAEADDSPKQKKRRRRRRHWDEQDDGQSASKRRCTAGQTAVPAELSYDDESSAAAGPTLDYGNGNGDEITEGKEGKEGEEEAEQEEEDGEEDDDEYEGSRRQQYYDRCLYENGAGDSRGYYQDGAYTAAPVPAALEGEGDSSAGAAVDGEAARFSTAFRARLLERFGELRALLQQEPSAEAVAALPADHDTVVAPLSTRSGAFARWLVLLQTTDPLPAQVAAMDRVSTFRLLRVLLRGLLMGGSASSRSSRSGRFARWLAGGGKQGRDRKDAKGGRGAGLDMDSRTSQWLWAVLARLPDRGELGYVEVGYIRDVAKQAVMRLAHLSYDVTGAGEEEGEVAEEEEEEEQEQEEGEVAEEGEVKENGGEEDGEVVEDGPAKTEGQVGNGEDEAEDIAMDVESEPEEETGAKGGMETTVKAEKEAKEEAREDAFAGDEADKAGDIEDLSMHQRATLEMVLAVAGEFYGQRDLLAFRSPWPSSRA